jgi:DHA1 family multidrug resistance protein-like MFS transporter
MVGVGVILGPLLVELLSTDSLSLPFFIGSALAFIALFGVIFLLPESRPASVPTREGIPSTVPSAAARARVLDIYLRTILNQAGILLLLVFIMSFGMTNFYGMIGLYIMDKFTFNTKQVGMIWMVMGFVMIIARGVLVGPLSEKLGDPARRNSRGFL